MSSDFHLRHSLLMQTDSLQSALAATLCTTTRQPGFTSRVATDSVTRPSCLHLVHHVLLLIELALVLSGGILVLLVLGDEVVHVGLSLGELHLVHTLTSVPVKEGLATEHASELLGHTLEHLLDGGGVANEASG